jgi:putative ABC transport system permease protein
MLYFALLSSVSAAAMNSIRYLDTIRRDLLYALRTARKNPAFAVTAILTLALGIGGNTAIFSVIRAVLLKPLDYHDPDQLVRLGNSTPVRYEETKAAARSFSDVGAFGVVPESMTLTGTTEPEALKSARVSANFLRVLGVQPMLGRSFLAAEDIPGGPSVAMISAELWERRFGRDPLISGKTAALNSAAYTIIGVLPAGFQFPFAGIDVWVPAAPLHSRPLSASLEAFARLKPEVRLEQASAELTVLGRQYAMAHPGMVDARTSGTMRVVRLKDRLVANVRSMLWMLFGAVGFVLLIACANVASLLLARAMSRSREFAVRTALGASRARLIGQLLTESVLLAIAGGALGVLLAKWTLSSITHLSALDLPRVREIRLDGIVLGFAVLLSIATGVLFGLVPSLAASRPDLARVLRRGGGESKRLGFHLSPRGVLVIGQVALTVMLLVGAALLMQSLFRLYSVDPGFRPTNLLTMQIALPPARYNTVQKRATFFDDLVQRVESIRGVRGATMALTLPMVGAWPGSPVQLAEQASVKLSERPIAKIQIITPGYFRTLKIPLKQGREFTRQDSLGSAPVAIVNETLARQFLPAVGRRILIGASAEPVEVVGVVADVRDRDLGADAGRELYRPLAQNAPQSAMFVIATEADPIQFVNSIRSQVRAIDSDLPISAVRTMDEVIEASVGQRRLTMLLLQIFAGVAVVLALVGIYGVIMYSITQRTQELGIRRALGAQRGDILRLVLAQGLGLTLSGIGLGIAGALALTRVMKGLLFQVSATDPVTFAGVVVLFLMAALTASYIPARRATRIDPMTALRLE